MSIAVFGGHLCEQSLVFLTAPGFAFLILAAPLFCLSIVLGLALAGEVVRL
jgi:hypothetical protein